MCVTPCLVMTQLISALAAVSLYWSDSSTASTHRVKENVIASAYLFEVRDSKCVPVASWRAW